MAFDGTLKFDTKIDQSGFESGLSKIGGIAKRGMAVVAGAVTAATGAMAAIGVKALEAYADYEQLTGGVSTLFGAQDMSLAEYAQSIGKSTEAAKAQYDKLIAAQSAVMQNASDAFKTAGLSQNEYMETVTSFSAALIASLEGDTEKAARVADMAITDMSDNANKMGSSMESIQNAYQGFAKQNYTMLDNLKLGYGGTKSEMERLLADAQAISGIEYNIDSYADVVDAIHVIQTQMGITGTTAREAQSTIQGSLAMTKAAWQNLLVGIADDSADFDKLMDDLVASATAAGSNLIPRVEQIIKGIGKAIEKLLPVIIDRVPALIADVAPGIISAIKTLGSQIFNALMDNIPQIMQFATNLLLELVNGIIVALPALGTAAFEIVNCLASSLADALPTLIPAAYEAVMGFVIALTDPNNLSSLVDGAIALIMGLADGLVAAIPIMTENAPMIVENLATAIIDNTPKLLDAALELILALAEGLITNLPTILAAQGKIYSAILGALWNFAGTVLGWLGELCGNILSAIGNWFGNLISSVALWIVNLQLNVQAFLSDLPNKIGYALGFALGKIIQFGESAWNWAKTMPPKIVQSVVTFFTTLPGRLADIFGRVVTSVIRFGASMKEKATSAAKNTAKGILNSFTSLPGKLTDIGGNLVKGLWKGVDDMKSWIIGKVKGFGKSVLDGIKKALGIASPSKITKGYGRYLAQGLGIGFAAEMPQIGKAAAQMINSMKLPRPKIGIDSAAIEALNAPASGLLNGMLRPSPTSEVMNSSVANTYASTNNTYHQTLTFNQPIQTPSQVARAARKALEAK